MNAKSLELPENRQYLDMQIGFEEMIHNKMRLNTCYSAKHLLMACEYAGPRSTWTMVLLAAIERKKLKYIDYDGRTYYYRGIPIIREISGF